MTIAEELRLRGFRFSLLTLGVYVGTIGAVVWITLAAREQVIARLSTPEAEREWTEWREAAQKQANTGPVARRPPKSVEPPALIVMRDFFLAVMAAGLVFATFLFAIFYVALRSFWSPERRGSIKASPPEQGRI